MDDSNTALQQEKQKPAMSMSMSCLEFLRIKGSTNRTEYLKLCDFLSLQWQKGEREMRV